MGFGAQHAFKCTQTTWAWILVRDTQPYLFRRISLVAFLQTTVSVMHDEAQTSNHHSQPSSRHWINFRNSAVLRIFCECGGGGL